MPPSLFAYGMLNNVRLTPREYEELVQRLTLPVAERYIDRLSTYIPNRTKRPYKNHFAVILNWWLDDQDSGREATPAKHVHSKLCAEYGFCPDAREAQREAFERAANKQNRL